MSLRLHVLGLVAAAGMLAAGCSQSAPVTLASEDGQTHLTVYGGMVAATGLNDQASIQAANVQRGLYAMVISSPKPDGVTLADFDEQVRTNVRRSLISSTSSATKPIKISGMDAMQFTAVGRPPDATQTVAYLVTTVESAKGFHQVMAWTLASDFERLRPILEQVINSFQSADGPAQPSGAGRAAAPAGSSATAPGNAANSSAGGAATQSAP